MGSAYKVADKIAMIHEGKIIFHGSPTEIRQSRNPYIQQFIRGQRKRHYVVDDEDTYSAPIDLNKLKARPAGRRGAGGSDGSDGEDVAVQKFQMPFRPAQTQNQEPLE
jgi:phospholipid/cholesterol/gamma-HCH transport system ATP-binding protein